MTAAPGRSLHGGADRNFAQLERLSDEFLNWRTIDRTTGNVKSVSCEFEPSFSIRTRILKIGDQRLAHEIPRTSPPCRNDWTSAANRASVSALAKGLWASSRILPRWRYRHCGASVVTAFMPSQL